MLVLLRHGESEWNRAGRFTGWTDVDLSAAGASEAARAARRLLADGTTFDCCFTSVLRRATSTAEIVLQTMGLGHVHIEQSWRLNERHYGALQGLGFWGAVRRYGLRPLLRCQREFDYSPPALDPNDPRFPGHDPSYASLRPDELPRAESLRDTQARVLPYWRERIAPELARGRHVLIVSHKNVLRGLVKFLHRHDAANVKHIKVPTGIPLVFRLDGELAVVDQSADVSA